MMSFDFYYVTVHDKIDSENYLNFDFEIEDCNDFLLVQNFFDHYRNLRLPSNHHYYLHPYHQFPHQKSVLSFLRYVEILKSHHPSLQIGLVVK